jgi:NADH-quinone oxidoreductase subunit J
MGLVAYLVFGVLACLTALRAFRSRRRSGRALWTVCGCAFLVAAVIAAAYGIGGFPDLVFYVVALVAVVSAVRVVSQTNPVHSAVWLILVFLCMAVLFVLRQAEFLAAVQVIIYAGAIMVLYVFIIIFVDVDVAAEKRTADWMAVGVLGFAAMVALLVAPVALSLRPDVPVAGAAVERYASVQRIGEAIYFGATIPFEAVSLILLVGLVGALTIGRAEKE